MAQYRSVRAKPDVHGMRAWLARVEQQHSPLLNQIDRDGWPYPLWWSTRQREHQQTKPRLTLAEMRRLDKRGHVYTRAEKWQALLARQRE